MDNNSSDNNESNNINVKTINELKLERDTFITILSARKTGKSVLIADLVYYYLTSLTQKIDFLYMFSNTAYLKTHTNEQYDFIDKRCIIPAQEKYINPVIMGLMESQKKTNYKYHLLLVFDDIEITHKLEIINVLATRGRHYNISVILACQISNLVVTPAIRANTSYLFWRRLSDVAIKDHVYPILGLAFENYKDVSLYTKNNISDYKFIFYNNNKDYDPNSSIQIIKALPVPQDFQYKCIYPDDLEKDKKKYKIDNKQRRLYGPSLINPKNKKF